MSALGTLRENWRVGALAILLVLSGVALFAPTGASSPDAAANDTDATDSGLTNLVYGIQLDGGTRLRAEVVGLTAEGVEFGDRTPAAVARNLSNALGVDRLDVEASAGRRSSDGTPTVEVFSSNVTREEFAAGLQEVGVSATTSDVRQGVTAQTRQEMVRTIEEKITVSALTGGDARTVSTGTGEHYVVIEAPGRDAEDIRSLLREQGTVKVVAYYPDENGTYVNKTVLTQDDRYSVSPPQTSERYGDYVTVTLDQSIADRFANEMAAAGFRSQGTTCNFRGYGNVSQGDRCILAVSDGEVVHAAGVEPGLGEEFEDGTFSQSPQFIIQTQNRSEARELQINLRAGRLPAPLNFVSQYEVQPALASQFKVNSLITGLVAVLAVSFVVFLRYGDPRVAAPMVVTALSEVVILLGFTAAVGYPLDLSVIAGFVAVIGTGVDDLIIIADEVMAEDVSSRRVFKSRFRKALWTIGAAAATTVIAMLPIAGPWLSLGDLQGFAIVTILGVLVGVLVTRPAYGDVLRNLVTDQ